MDRGRTCGSIIAGARVTPTALANTRPNWSGSRRIFCLFQRRRCALRQATRTVPIVFASIIDPVGAGFVKNLARPGGNATGFTFSNFIGGKWLEILKEVAPRVTRAAVIRDATAAPGPGLWGAVQALAPSLGVDVSPVDLRDAGEIEDAVSAFAHGANGGLIVTASTLSTVHRDLIAMLAARHHLPAVYPSATSAPAAA